MLVHIIGQNPHMGVAHQHIRQRFQLGGRIGCARWIGRRIENEPFGFVGDRGFQISGLQLEPVFLAGVDTNRCAARQINNIGIADPIRRRNNDLVARVQRRHHRVVDHRLAARCHKALRELIIEVVIAFKLVANCLLQLIDTIDGCVFRFAAADRIHAGFLNVLRRVEIRLAGTKANNITTRSAQSTGLVRDGNGRRRLNA